MRLVLNEVLLQALRDVLFLALRQLLLDLIQGKMHHIVMMQLLRPDEIAQPQPKLVDEIDFIPRQVGRVRTKKEELVLTLTE